MNITTEDTITGRCRVCDILLADKGPKGPGVCGRCAPDEIVRLDARVKELERQLVDAKARVKELEEAIQRSRPRRMRVDGPRWQDSLHIPDRTPNPKG